MFLTWKLAGRNILRNKKRSFLTILLITLSLVVLIFTDGFLIGMSQNMIQSATRLFSGDAQIHHPQFLESYDAEYRFHRSGLVENLFKEPMVSAATERTLSVSMVSSSANVASVQTIGINPDTEKNVSKILHSVISGQYLTGKKATEIMIGHLLAEKLEVQLNDRIVLSIPRLDQSDISQELFRVSGIFKFNSKQMDEGLVFIPLERSLQLMGEQHAIQEIAFNFFDPMQAQNEDLELWRKYSNSTQIAQGWTQLMPSLSSYLGMIDYSLFIVGVILFIIAALGVINSMFMSIYERIWEFGVIKAVGTTPVQIFWLIMAEGMLLAIISAISGVILGLLANYLVSINGLDYSQMEFSGVTIVEPVRIIIRPMQFIQLPIWVVSLTLLACIYPAVFAARLIPSKALHKSL